MAEPSLRYVIVNLQGEMRTSRTEYLLGRNSRFESRDCQGYCDGDPTQPGAMQFQYGPLRALIQNRDLHYQFHVDLESRVYTSSRLSEYGSAKRRGRPLRPSGRTVHVRTETIDSGERQEMFGHTARRMIIRMTHRFSPENDTGSSEIDEADGWYIDPPAAWLSVHPPNSAHAILQSVVNGKVDVPVFTDVGPRETGFPLLVTRTHRSSFNDAEGNLRMHTSSYREEVTEFSEETLGPDLFLPPGDFRRVLRLPGERALSLALRMRVAWENLKGSFVARY